MSKVAFVKMKRLVPNPLDNLTEIDVHPEAVDNHLAAGWFVAPDQDTAKAVTAEPVGEVVVPEELKGKLPEDFPGHAALAEAGINTYAQLRKAGDVTGFKGIGEATAKKIADALAAVPEGAEK